LLLNVFVHFYSHSPEYSYDFCLGRAKRAGPGGDLTDLDEDVRAKFFRSIATRVQEKLTNLIVFFQRYSLTRQRGIGKSGNREIGKSENIEGGTENGERGIPKKGNL